MSLRRSARGPTHVSGHGGSQNTNSSSSSVISMRAERSVRSAQKLASPQSSLTRSSEEFAGPSEGPPRRTRSTNSDTKQEFEDIAANNHEEDSEEEETRCICGHLEYPGLPVIPDESSKSKGEDSTNHSEDSTGWFIQCDECQVWQHGGCVGILDEAQSPEKYFCERCRKDLHKVAEDANGRKYSRYLPVQHANSHGFPTKIKDTTKLGRESRLTNNDFNTLSKGRRATMNSRDSAYDEAEQLRRAIEESKRDSLVRSSNLRRGKRSRSGSEESNEDAKRRRTASGAFAVQGKIRHESEPDGESMEPKGAKPNSVRLQRNRDLRDIDAENDKGQGDANKKKTQSTRKKTQEHDLSPDPPMALIPVNVGPNSSSGNRSIAGGPGTLPRSHKKGGRPPTRRGRLGRNQYSKDRESSSRRIAASPRSNSQEGESTVANGTAEGHNLGRPSKPRHMNPNRTTMNDMKRRVAGILEFISHTQVEMAALDAAKSHWNTPQVDESVRKKIDTSLSHALGEDTIQFGGKIHIQQDTDPQSGNTPQQQGEAEFLDEIGFGKLTAVEMMEVLTRRLMRWQGEYGKYGDR